MLSVTLCFPLPCLYPLLLWFMFSPVPSWTALRNPPPSRPEPAKSTALWEVFLSSVVLLRGSQLLSHRCWEINLLSTWDKGIDTGKPYVQMRVINIWFGGYATKLSWIQVIENKIIGLCWESKVLALVLALWLSSYINIYCYLYDWKVLFMSYYIKYCQVDSSRITLETNPWACLWGSF